MIQFFRPGRGVRPRFLSCFDTPPAGRHEVNDGQFTTLYSGSSGNCGLVRSGQGYLLVDMGKSCRITTGALKDLGLSVRICRASSSPMSTPTISPGSRCF